MTSLLGVIVFLAKVAYFARSNCVKSISIEDASSESTSIGTTYIKSVYIEDALTCTSNICIGTDIGDNFIRNTHVRYASSISTVQ